MVELTRNALESGAVCQRLQHRTLADLEPHPLAERMRNDQDVGKQNGSIETKAANRLQRDLCRQLRCKDQIEEVSSLFPQRPILGQIAAGLAH